MTVIVVHGKGQHVWLKIAKNNYCYIIALINPISGTTTLLDDSGVDTNLAKIM